MGRLLLGLLNRRANEISPLGPRAVVVLHVRIAEQVFEREPRMAGALADAAVCDHGPIASHACSFVQLRQLFMALERPVLVACLRPRDVFRSWNMTASLAGFGQP